MNLVPQSEQHDFLRVVPLGCHFNGPREGQGDINTLIASPSLQALTPSKLFDHKNGSIPKYDNSPCFCPCKPNQTTGTLTTQPHTHDKTKAARTPSAPHSGVVRGHNLPEPAGSCQWVSADPNRRRFHEAGGYSMR